MRGHKPTFRWLTGFLLAALGLGALGGAGLSVRAAPRQQTATNIVISEFRFRGPSGGDDEFIEIYNPTNTQVDISDWRIWGSNSSGGTGTTPRFTFPANTVLQSGQYYLVTNNTATTGYSGTVPGNGSYTTGITDNGGISLTLPDNSTIIDAVGLSNGSAYLEGTPLSSLGTSNQDRGYERKVGGNVGSCVDANDNSTDFQLRTPSNPQNLSSPTTSCGYLPLSVMINEVAWMGTAASSDDEWIELYNPGSSSINLTNWRLVAEDGSPDIVLNGTIPGGASGGFFLLERAYDNVIIDATANQIYLGELEDTNEVLRLRAPDGTIVDTANSDGGSWPAGTSSPNGSMERMGVVTDAPLAWVTNVNAASWTNRDASGQLIHGTPGRANWGSTVTHTPVPPTPRPLAELTIVINEVAWAGTQASSDDEWIELYNPGVDDIDLNGWSLRSADNSPSIALNGTIGAGDYYLLERTDNDTVANVAADLIYTGALSNSGEILRLYDPASRIIDTANSNGGAWPAGSSTTFSSMERGGVVADSDRSWVTYYSATARTNPPLDVAGNEINGTPGTGNLPFNVTATPLPTNTPRPGTGGTGSTGGSTSGGTVLQPLLGISEFLPRPGHDWNDDGRVDVFDEFIEIINAGQIDVDLSAYRLDDEQNLGSSPYSLPSITLEPGERAVFFASETGILLSDAGDTVRLLRGSSTVVDAYTYGVVRYPDQAWCRIPDRLGYWNDPCFPTPGRANALTGNFPLLPESVAGFRPPVCLLPDTTPDEFIYAECEAGGGEIWSRQYWDGADDSDRLNLDEVWKGETIFE